MSATATGYTGCCGNPEGKPALFLHGSPGSGCSDTPHGLAVALPDVHKWPVVIRPPR